MTESEFQTQSDSTQSTQAWQAEEKPPMQGEFSDHSTQLKRDYLKLIRKMVGRCALLLLILAVVTQALGVGIQYFIQNSSLAISDGMVSYFTSYFPCILGELITMMIAIPLLKPTFSNEVFCKPQESGVFILMGVLGCLGAANIGAYVLTQLLTMLELWGVSYRIFDLEMPTDSWLSMLLCASYICLIGPIFEEIIFRGLLLKAIQPFGEMTAIIISAVAFAMFHLNPMQFPTALATGLLLGYLAVRTKSIFPSMLAHIVNNSARALPGFMFSDVLSPLSILFNVLISVVGMVGILIFVYKFGRGFTNYLKYEDVSIVPVGKKLLHASINVRSILYILLFLLFTCYMIYFYFIAF